MPVTSVRLRDDVSEELESAARKLQRSKNWIINEAVKEYLAHEAEVEQHLKATISKIGQTSKPASSAPASSTSAQPANEDTRNLPEGQEDGPRPGWKNMVSWLRHLATDEENQGGSATPSQTEEKRRAPKLNLAD